MSLLYILGLKDYIVAIIKGCLMLDTAQVGGTLWIFEVIVDNICGP